MSGVALKGTETKQRKGLDAAFNYMKENVGKIHGLIVFRSALQGCPSNPFDIEGNSSSGMNFRSSSEDSLNFGNLFTPEQQRQSRLLLLIKCVMAEEERSAAQSRTQMSSVQRAIQGFGQSSSHQSTVISASTAGHDKNQNEKIMLVPHDGETNQMNAIIEKLKEEPNLTPAKKLQLLQSLNMDQDFRSTDVNARIVKASNLNRNFISYLAYQKKTRRAAPY